MKIIIREWLKDKKACAFLLIGEFAQILYTILNIRIVSVIADAINHYDNCIPYIIKLIIVQLSLIILIYISSTFRMRSRNRLFLTLNDLYEDKILDADYEMFTKFSCSNIITSNEQIWKIGSAAQESIRIMNEIIKIVILIISIYLITPRIIIPIAILYGIGFVLIQKAFKMLIDRDEIADKARRKRNAEIHETINGFNEVRSFCTEEIHRKSTRKLNLKVLNARNSKQNVNSGLDVLFHAIDTCGIVLIITYSVSEISKGRMDISAALSLVMYVWRLIDPLVNISDQMTDLSSNFSQIKEYDAVVNYKNNTTDNGKISLSSFNSNIQMRNVSFSYDDANSVINNLNITIKKGQRVGICGTSGGGKTTIFKLLSKFYVPSKGEILIDGIPYSCINGKSLRSHMGIVSQETHIFAGTIKENILYANKHATEYELISACKKANIYDFISNLPDKFDTDVGPNGLKLSGGQKQRIALARIFLKDADIILLDEATSALDNESETLIQDSLNSITGKTIITIAHRLSTIRNSDIIYVIGNHKVIESGTHDELISKKGEYYKLNK